MKRRGYSHDRQRVFAASNDHWARFGVARSVLSVELLRTITLVVPKSEQHESALGLPSPECHNPFSLSGESEKQ